jgi:hypothetical protein
MKQFLLLLIIGWVCVRVPCTTEIPKFLNTLTYEEAQSAKITTSFGDYVIIYRQEK